MASVQSSTAAIETTALKDKALNRIVVASVAGNAMEWYEFFVYGTAATLVFGQGDFISQSVIQCRFTPLEIVLTLFL